MIITWISTVILELIHASRPDFCGRVVLIRHWTIPACPVSRWLMVIERIACFGGDDSFKFLTYQLPTVGYWPTVALTGNGELGFDSGEGAWETATTSKEGSRRVNYPILTQGGSDKKYQYRTFVSCNWDERNLNRFSSINWRASLVPAAAVIPAPIAYIKIVAVKTLVVGCMQLNFGPSKWRLLEVSLAFVQGRWMYFTVWPCNLDLYFEEIRVFQAGFRREYDSME